MGVLNDKLGLTPEKHHLNFPTLGNIGPAAVPITLSQAAESGRIPIGRPRSTHGDRQRPQLLDDEHHMVGMLPLSRKKTSQPVASRITTIDSMAR
jgi:hypothetical protein